MNKEVSIVEPEKSESIAAKKRPKPKRKHSALPKRPGSSGSVWASGNTHFTSFLLKLILPEYLLFFLLKLQEPLIKLSMSTVRATKNQMHPN